MPVSTNDLEFYCLKTWGKCLAEKLDEVTLQWAQRLANGPTLAYARTKKLFFEALSIPLKEHLENERQMQVKSAETEDYKRGVFALIDKKEPEFIGK